MTSLNKLIGVEHLVGRRTEELRDLRSDPSRRAKPAVAPGSNQTLAPLPIDRFAHPTDTALGQSTQRIAIEIDQVGIDDHELVTKASEHVLSIELAGVIGVDGDGHEAIIAGARSGAWCLRSGKQRRAR